MGGTNNEQDTESYVIRQEFDCVGSGSFLTQEIIVKVGAGLRWDASFYRVHTQ